MNYIAGQNCLSTVYHKEACVSSSTIWRGPQPPEYGVEILYLVRVRLRTLGAADHSESHHRIYTILYGIQRRGGSAL